MSSSHLQGIADQVARLVQQQGYVVEREVREELARAGLPEAQWKDVLALALPQLSYRRGRYYSSAPPALAEPAGPTEVQAAVAHLVAWQQHDAGRVERREQGRTDFIQPVQ